MVLLADDGESSVAIVDKAGTAPQLRCHPITRQTRAGWRVQVVDDADDQPECRGFAYGG